MTSRPQPLALEELPAEAKALYDQVVGFMGFLPNSTRTMAKRPELQKRLRALVSYMFGSEITIEPQLRNMICYIVAYGAKNSYCEAHGAEGAYRSGVDREKVANLWRFETSPLFDERERAVLSFALAAVQQPNAVEESHYEALAKYFDELQILDLVAIISITGFLNRWQGTLATQLEGPPREFAETVLKESGWEIGRHA